MTTRLLFLALVLPAFASPEDAGRYVYMSDYALEDSIAAARLAGDWAQAAQLADALVARREVESIAALFDDTTTLYGEDASEARVRSLQQSGDMRQHAYLHFATHAIADDTQGSRSVMVLSQVGLPEVDLQALRSGERISDRQLSMEEIMREWYIDAELVTLSACETALGFKTGGDGYVGLAHAFFAAGARAVVASLWKVGDEPTRRFMSRFYENMLTRDMDKSAAPQEANIWLRSFETCDGRQPYTHPAYWSAFILMGDPE